MNHINSFNLLLEVLIITSLIFSLIVITSTNPVVAIIYLIGVFLNAAIYLILIGLDFIGISYIIVYIGAITVLFLFVIMMINTDILNIVEIGPEYGKNLPLAYSLSLCLLLYFSYIFMNSYTDFSLDVNNSYIHQLGLISTTINLEVLNFFNVIFTNIFSSTILDLSILDIFNNELFTGYNLYNSISSIDSSLVNLLQIDILGYYLFSYGAILLNLSVMILLLALVTPILLSKTDK